MKVLDQMELLGLIHGQINARFLLEAIAIMNDRAAGKDDTSCPFAPETSSPACGVPFGAMRDGAGVDNGHVTGLLGVNNAVSSGHELRGNLCRLRLVETTTDGLESYRS